MVVVGAAGAGGGDAAVVGPLAFLQIQPALAACATIRAGTLAAQTSAARAPAAFPMGAPATIVKLVAQDSVVREHVRAGADKRIC